MPADWWDPNGPAAPPTPPPKPRRRWRDKFREAARGVKLGVRGHSSFSVHFFFAALVVTAAATLECTWVEWCVVLGCVGAVLTAELFNSAIETLYHGLDPDTKDRGGYRCLDVAAGAVLIASLTAVVIGSIVFVRKLLILTHHLPAG